jgi:hypothetical protein
MYNTFKYCKPVGVGYIIHYIQTFFILLKLVD